MDTPVYSMSNLPISLDLLLFPKCTKTIRLGNIKYNNSYSPYEFTRLKMKDRVVPLDWNLHNMTTVWLYFVRGINFKSQLSMELHDGVTVTDRFRSESWGIKMRNLLKIHTPLFQFSNAIQQLYYSERPHITSKGCRIL